MNDIKIGFVIEPYSSELINQVLFEFPNVEAVYLYINTHTNLDSIISKAEGVESLVFTQKTNYELFVNHPCINVPCHLIPISALTVYEALLNIDTHFKFHALSLDSINPNTQTQLLKLNLLKKYNLDFIPSHHFSEASIIKSHISNYTKNKALILTTHYNVHQHMVKNLIPSELIHAAHSDIANTLERALLTTRSRINNESNAAVCILSFLSKARKQKLCTQMIREIITSITKALEGYYYETEDGFNIITKQGRIEHYTQGFKHFPLFDLCSSYKIDKLYAGIGFASHFDLAHKNAILALKQSESKEESCCYIVREDQTAYGPISSGLMPSNEKFSLSITDEKLLKVASVTGMSANYINKITDKLTKLKVPYFTALDIAELENITLRSANRTLLKLSDAEVVEVIGEEKINSKGRPRRIYSLKR